MTELLIVSKPRGRIHKWIYGQYKEYLSEISFDKSGSLTLDVNATGGQLRPYNEGDIAMRFKTPDIKVILKQVSLWLRQTYDSTTYDIDVELWSDNDGVPGSKIATLGTLSVSANTFTEYQITGLDVELDPNTYYWIYCPKPSDHHASSDLRLECSTSNVYDDGYVWTSNNGQYSDHDLHMKLVFGGYHEISFDFIYSGAAEKRLEITFTSSTGLSKITVNDQDTGTDLTKEESIPQADNYVVKLVVTDGVDYDLAGSLQRWLYFNKTSITLDDLNVSEAYIQEIEYGADGGVLRIDDDPAGDLVGSANETIQFTDILVPFRKLEWISGGGEVLILGVE